MKLIGKICIYLANTIIPLSDEMWEEDYKSLYANVNGKPF